jgi:3-hydroxy acid dehydrogenase/malonic semialdehyde reductase
MIIAITGVTAGFGSAMAKLFIKNNFKVIGLGRRQNRLNELHKELGQNFLPLEMDVTQKELVEKTFAELPKDFSNVDVLVNNAGLALGMESAQKADITDWEVMVDTNIKGVLYCTHALLAKMVKRNQGHIINLGSVAGEFPYPGGNVYGASKAFIHQFSLNLRADLVGTPIRVTNIEPGLCGGTEFSEVRFRGDTSKAESVYKGVRYLTAEDVAETVLWTMTRPPHVNINVISLMPVQQAFGAFAINRD